MTTSPRYEITTAAGGHAIVRRVELMPNGKWRVDFVGGLVETYATDPRPAFARGVEPVPFAPKSTRPSIGDIVAVMVDGKRIIGTVYHVRPNGWPCVKGTSGHIASGPMVS